jgi:hypothetical protein
MSRRLYKYLNSVGASVVRQAKANLSKKSNTGKLESSIDYNVKKQQEGVYALEFTMSDYGIYVDKGVSGTKKRRMATEIVGTKLVKRKSPFSYKPGVGNSPNIGALQKWISSKGIRGRDDLGRFIKTKSLAYLISKSIQREGLKGISFFTKPLGYEISGMNDGLLQAVMYDHNKQLKETRIKLQKRLK